MSENSRSSIYFKNFIATAGLVIISFIMLGSAFVFLGRSYLINEYRDKMDRNADEVVHAASALYLSGGISGWDLRMVITSLATSSGNHIFITDSGGLVLLCSDRQLNCAHIGKQLSQNVMTELTVSGKMDQLSNLDGFYSDTRFVVAKPINSADGDIVGYVFISADTSSIVGAYRTFMWVALAVASAVMMFALLISLVYSKKMAEPLDEMAVAARKFAHGDFSVRIKNGAERTDEVGALIDSFNEMADSLEKSEERRNAFIGNISHELRTPMTTIAGFADGILDGTIPKDQEDKYLVAIADETRRLSRLVRNMLDVSQLQARVSDKSRRKDFDLTELILQTLLSFEKRADEKKLDMDLQLPEDHISVYADPDAITQVVYNLVDNAVKFAFESSVITVLLYKKSGKAYVSVKDRGETIPPDDLPFIFDRFHKSDHSRGLDKDGVGLGLYLVKTIINSHDEDIAVTSRDGVTEFVFTLTLSETEKAEPRIPNKERTDAKK
jgi:signal transduction histidine kinase